MIRLTTNFGVITLQLFADKAPATVANFEQYVKDGHYDGTVFHRVINGFMIQGGGFEAGMLQKPTREPIANEANNGLKNKAYTIAMARTNAPDTAGAHFFINVKDNGFLDPVPIPDADPVPRFVYQGRTYTNVSRASLERAPQLYGYTVFGKVVSGMDTVMRIRQQPTGPLGPFASDVPRHTVLIESATQIK